MGAVVTSRAETSRLNEKLTILIADDEQLVRNSLRALLSAAGFDVVEASSGAEGLALIEQKKPSLLISDINMPGNDNLEFVAEVSRRYPGLPVVLLTAFPSVETAVASVNLSVAAYLVKPPHAKQVLDAVRSAIGHYEARVAIERSLGRLGEWSDDLEKLRRLTVNVRASTDANSSGAYLEVSLRHLMGALFDLQEVVSVLSSAPTGAGSVRSLELSKALEETIEVLEKTKRVFKSKDLGELRAKLEQVLAASRA
jgi:YesN/AraC family two-component response regulator